MTSNCHFLASSKQAVIDLVEDCFFKVGSQIFGKLLIFFYLFSFHYETEWISKMKNIYHHYAWMFGHIYRFIDDLINNSKEFEKSFMEIYPVELELKKENEIKM